MLCDRDTEWKFSLQNEAGSGQRADVRYFIPSICVTGTRTQGVQMAPKMQRSETL